MRRPATEARLSAGGRGSLGSGGASARGDGPAPRGSSWVLLPTAWCAWLLVWLAPALMLEPYVATPLAWLRPATAPAALLAGAAVFLVVVWPFWPALAAGRAGGADWICGRLVGRSVAELLILAAVAAPMLPVAWSVGGRGLDSRSPWPLCWPATGWPATAAGGLAALGLALRLACAGIGRAAGKWLMFAAMLATVGPLLLAYGVAETLEVVPRGLVEVSPMVAAVRLALEGWPRESLPVFVRLVLWPAASVVLVLAALSEMRWRRRRGETGDE